MKIGGFMKLTLLDYPNHVACLIFTQGCNMKCPYCHNSSLIKSTSNKLFSEEEIFTYLEKRKKILDGVSISGGEPLIQKDLKEFIKKIKELGLDVKIDTNGSMPEVLKELIKEKLVDYVAMDIKNSFKNYSQATGVSNDTKKIKESIKVLEESNTLYEFRTTVVKEIHTIDDIKEILKMINKKSTYYIQNFNLSGDVPNKHLHGLEEKELLKWQKELERKYPNINFRDI